MFSCFVVEFFYKFLCLFQGLNPTFAVPWTVLASTSHYFLGPNNERSGQGIGLGEVVSNGTQSQNVSLIQMFRFIIIFK